MACGFNNGSLKIRISIGTFSGEIGQGYAVFVFDSTGGPPPDRHSLIFVFLKRPPKEEFGGEAKQRINSIWVIEPTSSRSL